MTLWLNGELLSAGRIDPADRGFTLGDGLFETIRVADGRPAFLDRHLARLRHGAQVLEIPVLATDPVIADTIQALCAAEALSAASVRITLTRGAAARGVLPPATVIPTLLITIAPAAAPAGPASVMIATVTRRNEHSPLSRLKTLNYLDGVLARQEAARAGFDDALLLNTAGLVAEATAANLVVRLDGGLVTPPVTDGALPGIMRGVLIERCGVVERSIRPADLDRAEVAFLANSLGLRTISRISARPLGGVDADLIRRCWAVVAGQLSR